MNEFVAWAGGLVTGVLIVVFWQTSYGHLKRSTRQSGPPLRNPSGLYLLWDVAMPPEVAKWISAHPPKIEVAK